MTHAHPTGVPILTFHQVGRFPAEVIARQRGNYVDVKRFAGHLSLLKRWGYTPVTLAAVAAWHSGNAVLPARPIVLTFDDAYRCVFEHAAPLLASYGWSATTFAVSGELGGHNDWDQSKGIAPAPLMSTDELKELQARGWEIGAHSRSHADLTRLDAERLTAEVAGCRTDLERELGLPPTSWCYPYGRVNPNATAAVAAAGFQTAVTLAHGVVRRTHNPFLLPRIHIGYRLSPARMLLRLKLAAVRQ